MRTSSIEEKLKVFSRLSLAEQRTLTDEIRRTKVFPIKRWRWQPCVVKVLLVTDSPLNFGLSPSGLSTFLRTFVRLEQESSVHISYHLTIAHRSNLTAGPTFNSHMQPSNIDIDKRIVQFRFDNSNHFTPTKYDQVWLFGFSSTSGSLAPQEKSILENYMNGGGGLFATGDHGSLGRALCGEIVRVKDMRHWTNSSNEVGMSNARRNDTNQPSLGQINSTSFYNQSDDILQNIHARMFGGVPHPLLAAPTTVSPSGILHYMPDHPHEGECKPERNFTVTNPKTGLQQTIRSQNIAVSFVPSGNITTEGSGKCPTEAHCFPSISVFDGRPANVGRIVIDSTWHHFINDNLNGFSATNHKHVEQYYMNIARWVTRRKLMLCIYKRFIIEAMFSENVIEATLNQPDAPLNEIDIEDLRLIGVHAEEFVGRKLNPSEGKSFTLSLLEPLLPKLSEQLFPWRTEAPFGYSSLSKAWTRPESIAHIALGAGIIGLRDGIDFLSGEISEEQEEAIDRIFTKGARLGIQRAIASFNEELQKWSSLEDGIVQDDYLVEGSITDAKGNPLKQLTVRAFDQDFVGENPLGAPAVTDDEGYYRIPYKQTDFVINGKESGGADIVLKIYDKTGKLLDTSKRFADSKQRATVNWQVK